MIIRTVEESGAIMREIRDLEDQVCIQESSTLCSLLQAVIVLSVVLVLYVTVHQNTLLVQVGYHLMGIWIEIDK